MSDPFWTPEALEDLKNFDAYYSGADGELADKMLQTVFAASRFLVQNPRVGAFIEDAPVRKWRVQRLPPILLYRERANSVEILRVRHAREDWKRDLI